MVPKIAFHFNRIAACSGREPAHARAMNAANEIDRSVTAFADVIAAARFQRRRGRTTVMVTGYRWCAAKGVRMTNDPQTPKIPPAEFGSELVSVMKTALEDAVARIPAPHRTSATKAKMAERIVRTASEGVTGADRLVSAAIDEGNEPAA